jgi:hypothetical protein
LTLSKTHPVPVAQTVKPAEPGVMSAFIAAVARSTRIRTGEGPLRTRNPGDPRCRSRAFVEDMRQRRERFTGFRQPSAPAHARS